MNVRKRGLPAGWYPEGRIETESLLGSWRSGESVGSVNARGSTGMVVSVVVPHAGWYYSGELAFFAIRRLAPPSTVVVVGGHLPAHDSVLVQLEDAAETPLEPLQTDTALRDAIIGEFAGSSDATPDNTVEIHLPIVKYLFPDVRFVGLRVSPTDIATRLGRYIADWSVARSQTVAVIGSTDLTHYGLAYGFSPHGDGPKAEHWAEQNDRRFLDALVSMDFAGALDAAQSRRAACSAGAAVVAGSFARACEIERGEIVGYESSARKGNGGSFVGYGAVIYEKRDTIHRE